MSTIWADTNTMTNIDNLIEQLGKLTVIEAGELSKRLEKAWGLDLNAYLGASAPAPVEVIESATATVMLMSHADDKKISVLKKVREYFEGMGLLEAKNFIEDLPKAVKENIDKEEAETIKKALEEAGGTVELK